MCSAPSSEEESHYLIYCVNMPRQRSRRRNLVTFKNTVLFKQTPEKPGSDGRVPVAPPKVVLYSVKDLLGPSVENRMVIVKRFRVRALPAIYGDRYTAPTYMQVGVYGPLWTDDNYVPNSTLRLINAVKPTVMTVKPSSPTMKAPFNTESDNNYLGVLLTATDDSNAAVNIEVTTFVDMYPQQEIKEIIGKTMN